MQLDITSLQRKWLLSKRLKISSDSEDMEKREPLHSVDGNVYSYSHYGKPNGFSKN
jgi:hypothetical protein